MEGASLLPLLTGASDAPVHDCLVSQECSYQKKWAIRADGFKFILSRAPDWHGGPPEELYDLRADPQELENIAGARPDVADALRSRLEAWIADMMARNGLERDPLVTQDLTLGKGFAAWLKERGYR
jgi:arylsulfatase A-like enzyme